MIDGNAPSAIYRFRGVPLTPNVIAELIREERAAGRISETFRRSDVLTTLEHSHVSRGGLNGSAAYSSFKKALTMLRKQGLLEMASPQFWRFTDNAAAIPTNIDILEDALSIEAVQPVLPNSKLCIEEEIGVGAEAVYVYYQPNDRGLAIAEGRGIWECKIGMTRGAVDARIISQHSLTTVNTLPVLGLVIRTPDAYKLEKLLHALLSSASASCTSSPGTEWFMTSPARVKRVLEVMNGIVDMLRPDANP